MSHRVRPVMPNTDEGGEGQIILFYSAESGSGTTDVPLIAFIFK